MIKAMKLWNNTQLQQQDRTELIVWQQIFKIKKMLNSYVTIWRTMITYVTIWQTVIRVLLFDRQAAPPAILFIKHCSVGFKWFAVQIIQTRLVSL